MELFGVTVDFSSPVFQAVVAIVVVGFITLIAVARFYAYITCGVFKAPIKMIGKTVIVTGANTGIGKETAKDLAKRGAKVIIACRNVTKGEAAREEIINATGNNSVFVKKLDLSSFTSIREFAADINKSEPKLHVLVHNAGTAETFKKLKSEDGLELTMATNHYGPFLLTHLLIDLLKRSGPSRIVIVASSLYRLATVNLENMNPVNTLPGYLYYVSKYANIYFTHELSRRLEGTYVTANCLHPGLMDTGIWANVPFPMNMGLKLIAKMFFKTIEQGAQTSIYLAVSDEVSGISGKYFSDCTVSTLSAAAMDMAKAKKVWEISEEMVKLLPTDPKI